MAIILSIFNKKKQKSITFLPGSLHSILLLFVGVGHRIINRLSEEEGLSREAAEDFVVDWFREGIKLVKTKSGLDE